MSVKKWKLGESDQRYVTVEDYEANVAEAKAQLKRQLEFAKRERGIKDAQIKKLKEQRNFYINEFAPHTPLEGNFYIGTADAEIEAIAKGET